MNALASSPSSSSSSAPLLRPIATPAPLRGALDARAAALMVLLCLVWSLQQISLKAIAAQASPMLVVALRSVVALGLLAALMWRRGEALQRACRRPGAVVGLLFALEYLLVSEALRWTQASHVVVFLYTAPIFAALGLQRRLPAERLNRLQWIGIALAFGGIAYAFLGSAVAPHAGATGPSASASLWGDVLALLAGAAWGATTVTIRTSALSTAPATETLFYQLLGAAVLLGGAAAATGQWRFVPTPAVWAHLAFQSLVVSFASFLAWCWLLRRYVATQLGAFSFLTPLFGVLLGVALLGEALEAPFVLGGAAVLAGIGLVTASFSSRRSCRSVPAAAA